MGLRDHGRRRTGLPQDQNHGQHPEVLLPDLLHRLPQGHVKGRQGRCLRRGEEGFLTLWWKGFNPHRELESHHALHSLDGQPRESETDLRRGQGQAAVGERYSPGGSGQPCCPGQQRLPQKTWARSFTISTLLDTTSSRTCHKVITRSAPSTGSPPRP